MSAAASSPASPEATPFPDSATEDVAPVTSSVPGRGPNAVGAKRTERLHEAPPWSCAGQSLAASE